MSDQIPAAKENSRVANCECPMCAEPISARAKKCKHCGEVLDIGIRRAEEALRAVERQSGPIIVNNNNNLHNVHDGHLRPAKSRGLAIILALLLGGIGAHKFYLGRPGQGLLYLLFFWTYIPAIVGLIEGVIYMLSNSHNWHLKYG